MNLAVATSTEGNQILFVIASRTAAEVDVVDFKSSPCATVLACPAIALEHSLVQLEVRISVQL